MVAPPSAIAPDDLVRVLDRSAALAGMVNWNQATKQLVELGLILVRPNGQRLNAADAIERLLERITDSDRNFVRSAFNPAASFATDSHLLGSTVDSRNFLDWRTLVSLSEVFANLLRNPDFLGERRVVRYAFHKSMLGR
jgi:hypothetical protein